jgi:hypothetical protein
MKITTTTKDKLAPFYNHPIKNLIFLYLSPIQLRFKQPMFECQVCSKKFKSKNKLAGHLEKFRI